MCNQVKCEYGHECQDCVYNIGKAKRKYTKTGLDTADIKAYKREWSRIDRAKKLQRDMVAAGVA